MTIQQIIKQVEGNIVAKIMKGGANEYYQFPGGIIKTGKDSNLHGPRI